MMALLMKPVNKDGQVRYDFHKVSYTEKNLTRLEMLRLANQEHNPEPGTVAIVGDEYTEVEIYEKQANGDWRGITNRWKKHVDSAHRKRGR